MKPRCAAVVVWVAVCASGCAPQRAPVEVVGAPIRDTASQGGNASRPARALDNYQDALAAILDTFEHALGLPRVNVQLVLFADRERFEEGLLASGYPLELARSASSFAAIGGAREVFVNAGIVNGFDRTRRVQLIAHELVHSLQYQFGNGTRGASEQWLREGFADWISFRATSQLGLAPFDAQREHLLTPLIDAPFGLAPTPLNTLVTFPQWVDAQRRSESPLYVQAFIAAELLIEMRGVPTVISYFEQFKTTNDFAAAFVSAFGLERREFDSMFARRWRETLARYRMRR